MAPRKQNFINYIIIDLPAPGNLSFAWSFGSLLGLILSVQIVSGLLLAIHYSSRIQVAFDRVAHIQREVNRGWFLRTVHSNGASIFFILLYSHIARGIYYGSYRRIHTWYSGVTLYVLSIAIAFMGYLLPWGQMRFWGATVITNLFRATPYIGGAIVGWLWGGYAVGEATLGRFFAGHFILPFVLVVIVLIHLISLHTSGSSNPLGASRVVKVSFHPYYPIKDVVGFLLGGTILIALVFYYPFYLGDPDNWIPANRIVTPVHIKPEWYFLWVYAILRSVPNKLGGVVLLVAALIILYVLSYKTNKFASRFWWLIIIVTLLSWIGASPVEHPYTIIGAFLRFSYFIIILVSSCVR